MEGDMVSQPSMLVSSFVLSATLAFPMASKAKSQDFDSSFDNVKSNAALPELNPVGVYNELLRNAFSVVPPSDTGIDEGLVAHSPPNLIASGIPERLKNGTAFITSLYHGSPVASFDLKGFYFGCTPDVVTGEATLADGCVLLFGRNSLLLYLISHALVLKDMNSMVADTIPLPRGTKQEPTPKLGPWSLIFPPKPQGLKVPMIFAELPSNFTRLNKVTLVPVAIGVDNVQNTICYY
ncbi:hypothetical protein G7Y79_00069g096600 [Physcia stellaris]|nr:hypothetical protein G7Y79_00069g096600 [Physcia stellaris]